MHWLLTNWFWVLIGIAFIAMHVFGFGCHGGHGHNHGSKQPPSDDETKKEGMSKTDVDRNTSSHHH